MAAEEEGVRYTRVLESFDDFRDKEIIYGALSAAILLVQQTNPKNDILVLLTSAQEHRIQELQDTYAGQKYRERSDSD